jgi:tetratricopeptide (TPR) repeat protein/predicted Ser/Thr protein kinase
MIGRRLDHYRIVEQLGAGGMGVVYRARDEELERDVALKVLPPSALADDATRKRFRQEALSLSQLNHPNICSIYEIGEADGQTYIVMECVEGRPLSALLGGWGLAVQTAMSYGTQIAGALAHAHQRGLLHRDLKSSNVMVANDGRVKVLDFGLAKRLGARAAEQTRTMEELTEKGTVVGTLAYMSPEILRGEPADARSELWALGVMLHEMVSGTRPFQGTTPYALSSAILREAAAALPERVPAGLRGIIHKCLAKEPGERYQSAAEVRAALEAVSSGGAVVAAAPVRSRRWILAGAVAAAVLGLLAAARALSDLRERWAGRAATRAGPRLTTGDRASPNREANEYFERAVLLLLGRSDLPRSREMLEKALAIDPRFAAARALYGFSHWRLIDWGYSNDTSWLYKAEEELRRALQDDPQVQAHGPLAAVYFSQGRKELVLAEIDKALKIDPNDRYALHWLAHYHRLQGDYEEALGLWRKILDREPMFWPSRMNIGDTLRMMGDSAGAIREQEKILEQSPENVFAQHYLTMAHLTAGHFGTARRTLERVRSEDRARFLIRMPWALTLALEGKREEAVKEMDEELLKWGAADILMTLNVAEFYTVLGDIPKALEWLERCVRSGDERAEWFHRDPLLASIRDQPRFRQVLESVEYRRRQRSRK